jgi:hypothetical protein
VRAGLESYAGLGYESWIGELMRTGLSKDLPAIIAVGVWQRSQHRLQNSAHFQVFKFSRVAGVFTVI